MSSILKVDRIMTPAGEEWGMGKVLQVVSTTKVDTFSVASLTYVDVPNLSVTITPQFTTSKILVISSTVMSSDYSGTWGGWFLRTLRNGASLSVGSEVGQGTGTGASSSLGGLYYYPNNSTRSNTTQELDTPNTTAELTYQIQVASVSYSGTRTIKVNGSTTVNAGYGSAGISTITVMEIGI